MKWDVTKLHPSRVRVIMGIEILKKKHQLRLFIGIVDLYQRLNKKQLHMLDPSVKLPAKNYLWVWT